MHDLAVKIGTVNDSQHEEDMQETLKKLELLLITDVSISRLQEEQNLNSP